MKNTNRSLRSTGMGNKMKTSLKAFTALGLALQLASCTTTSNKSAKNVDSGNIFETSTEKVVVQRMGAKNPVISPFGRNHWVKARSSKKASLQRIQGLMATGESLEAERTARRFLANNPGNLEGLTALSSALAMSGQYDLASYYAKLVSKKLPENPHSLNIQGLAALMGAKRIEEYRRAESLFQRSFDSSDSEIAAGLNLGHLYLELGNSNAALQVFETTTKRCDNCVPALMGYGVAARRLDKFPEALVAFKNVLSEDKNNAPAMYHMALVYRDGMADQKKAEESLRTLLATQSVEGSIKEHAHTLLRSMRAETQRTHAIAEQKAAESKEKIAIGDDFSKKPSDDSWADEKSDSAVLIDELDNTDLESTETANSNTDDLKVAPVGDIATGTNDDGTVKSDFDKYETPSDETSVAEESEVDANQQELSENDSDFGTVDEIETDSKSSSEFSDDDTFNAEFETQSDSEDSF